MAKLDLDDKRVEEVLSSLLYEGNLRVAHEKAKFLLTGLQGLERNIAAEKDPIALAAEDHPLLLVNSEGGYAVRSLR